MAFSDTAQRAASGRCDGCAWPGVSGRPRSPAP